MKYKGYTPKEQCTSFWTWVYCSWNYIGGTPIQRHIGVRHFGYEWEEVIEIPFGELRF